MGEADHHIVVSVLALKRPLPAVDAERSPNLLSVSQLQLSPTVILADALFHVYWAGPPFFPLLAVWPFHATPHRTWLRYLTNPSALAAVSEAANERFPGPAP